VIDLVGNEKNQHFLEENSLTGSWIFYGPNVGKSTFAKTFALKKLQQASSFLGSDHPDLHLYKPLGKAAIHTASSMKALKKQLCLPPTLTPFHIFILENSERLPVQAMNFLLKSLEEPPKNTTIILIASNSLLPTVESRCQKLYFQPIKQSVIEQFLLQTNSAQVAKKASLYASGSITRALRFIDGGMVTVEHLLHLLQNLKNLSFSTIKQSAQFLHKQLEIRKKALESKLLAILAKQKERYTVSIQEFYKKQIEGEVALFSLQMVDELFEMILSFFRDSLLLGRDLLHMHSLVEIDTLLMQSRKELEFGLGLQVVLEKLFINLSNREATQLA